MRDLLDIIWQRHTCRAAFDSQRKIREADLQLILDAARWSPTAHNSQNFEIIAVDDQHSLAAICALDLPPTETFAHEHLVVIYDGRITAHAAEGNALVLMSLGCVMQSMWLMTERLGISLQILSGFGACGLQDRVQRILNIPGHMRIAFAARLGYPTSTAESYLRVRRGMRDFTHRNRYRAPQAELKDDIALAPGGAATPLRMY